MQPVNTTSLPAPDLLMHDWQFMEVWVDPLLHPPYVLLLLGYASGLCQICDPQAGNRLVFSTSSYAEATQWLAEDEYEPVQGRIEMAELSGASEMNPPDNVSSNRSISIGGNVTGSTINTGTLHGSITNHVTQLQQSSLPQANELADLLLQLQAFIEQSDDSLLKPEDKALALEQLKELAIASQKPDEEKKTLGKRSLTFLRGIVAAIPTALPTAATLVEGMNKLIPAIATLLGL